MSERPTPETDKAKCKFTSLFGDDEDAYWVPLKVARRLERERDTERALADRLAEALMSTDSIIRKEVSLIGQWSSPDVCKEALAAWKEVRKEH